MFNNTPITYLFTPNKTITLIITKRLHLSLSLFNVLNSFSMYSIIFHCNKYSESEMTILYIIFNFNQIISIIILAIIFTIINIIISICGNGISSLIARSINITFNNIFGKQHFTWTRYLFNIKKYPNAIDTHSERNIPSELTQLKLCARNNIT